MSVLIKSSHPVSGTDVHLMFCHTQPLKYMLFWHHFALLHPNKYVMLSIRNGLNCIVLNNLTAAKSALVLMTVSRGCSQRQIHNYTFCVNLFQPCRIRESVLYLPMSINCLRTWVKIKKKCSNVAWCMYTSLCSFFSLLMQSLYSQDRKLVQISQASMIWLLTLKGNGCSIDLKFALVIICFGDWAKCSFHAPSWFFFSSF